MNAQGAAESAKKNVGNDKSHNPTALPSDFEPEETPEDARSHDLSGLSTFQSLRRHEVLALPIDYELPRGPREQCRETVWRA